MTAYFTTDMSLKMDPGFRKITEGFLNDPRAFDEACAKAWFKLTHRDLGPRARYLGTEVPEEEFIWQDPIPAVDHSLIDESQVASLKEAILDSGLNVSELVRTAWASASTYRKSDMRGGANGARIRLSPQKDWIANNPQELTGVLDKLESVQSDFNNENEGVQVSLADVIVLGGAAGIEQAAADGGHTVSVPFVPGRADAEQEMTDVDSFAVLELKADAFRNYYTDESYGAPSSHQPPHHYLDQLNRLYSHLQYPWVCVRTPRRDVLPLKFQLLTHTSPRLTPVIKTLRLIEVTAHVVHRTPYCPYRTRPQLLAS